MDLTIALVTDLHFGPEARFGGKLRKLTAHAPDLARDFIDRVNRSVAPDLVVNLGDDIEDESAPVDRERYSACQAILRGARGELINVAGNHDTINLTPADLLAVWGRAPSPTPGGASDEATFGIDDPASRLYSSFDRAGVHFIVLHTRERKDRDVSIGRAQLAWLAADLEAARDRAVIVLMHHSAADQDLRGNRWFEGLPHICLVSERRVIRRLLEAHGGVLAVFNGHLHWNHLDVIRGVPYVTLQSLIENLDDDAPGRPAAAHAVVRVSKRRINIDIEGAERARYQVDRRA